MDAMVGDEYGLGARASYYVPSLSMLLIFVAVPPGGTGEWLQQSGIRESAQANSRHERHDLYGATQIAAKRDVKRYRLQHICNTFGLRQALGVQVRV